MITNTILGVPYYSYSIVGPKTLFQLLRPLFLKTDLRTVLVLLPTLCQIRIVPHHLDFEALWSRPYASEPKRTSHHTKSCWVVLLVFGCSGRFSSRAQRAYAITQYFAAVAGPNGMVVTLRIANTPPLTPSRDTTPFFSASCHMSCHASSFRASSVPAMLQMSLSNKSKERWCHMFHR